jgi:DNA-binding NtrC family response regulator
MASEAVPSRRDHTFGIETPPLPIHKNVMSGYTTAEYCDSWPRENSMESHILIVDDHPLYRTALALRVQLAFPKVGVLQCGSAEEVSRLEVPGELCLVVLDERLPGASGTEAIMVVQRRHPSAPVVVVSASEERHDTAAAIRTGARAVISKAAPTEALREVEMRCSYLRM